MFCSIIQVVLFLSMLLVAPITNIWLLIQDRDKIILLISCISTFLGSGTITLWFCSDVFVFKCMSFVCFIISLVLSSFQLGQEIPLATERFALMVLNIIGIVFYAGLAFLIEKQKNKIHQKEVEICRVNIHTGKRLNTL